MKLSEMAFLSNSRKQTVKNVQIDLQTTEIWLEKLNVPRGSEWVCVDIYVFREKLCFLIIISYS